MDMITNYYRPKRWVALLLTMLTVCLSASAADLTINAKAWEIGGQVGSTYDVTISNRTYAAGQWDMICLPFDASTSVLDAAFGSGNYTIQEFDALDGTKFKFKLMETREQFTDVLPDLLQCKITHQIVHARELLFRDAVPVRLIDRVRHEDECVLFVQLRVILRLVERQIGKYNIEHIGLQLLQQMARDTDGNAQRVTGIFLPVLKDPRGEMALVD